MAESVGKWLVAGVVCGLALSAGVSAQAPKADAVTALRQGFLHPPDAARPMVRWWWFGVAVTKPEILRELEQMEADGIGGAELAFVYPQVVDDPARGLKNLAFLSPEMLDAVHYAQTEGRRLGLRIDVTLCSGWPYGGPHTPLAEAAGKLRVAEVPVAAGMTSAVIPKLAEGDAVVSVEVLEVREDLVAAETGRHPRESHPETWKVGTAIDVPVGMSIRSRSQTSSVTFAASAKKRVAVFFISSHTRQQVKRAAVGAEGFVLDPFSHAAVATHLKDVGEPLVKAFGDTPPYAIFSD
ncbi:MAG: glycosyl hydrolase, partial [Acidobacteriaceae bacterium]